ncbi:MAG: DUF4851 domain-containing protein [Desulfovibrio sp.]|nr:DUF4851 domain-containing protein [Desulfovibrio sp.]
MLCVLLLALALVACLAGTQRGIQGNAYVSTARPAIVMQAKNLPMLTGGEGSCNLAWAGGLSGVPVRVWLAVYGSGKFADALAIVAQADVIHGWYWDDDFDRPFSVDNEDEIMGTVKFHASTYIVESGHDPFSGIVGISESSSPVRWIVRSYAARCNFNESKIILQYREPLPEHLAASQPLMGQTDWMRAFAQRARNAFTLETTSENRLGIVRCYADTVRWRYMDQRFLGTISRYDPLVSF